MGMTDEMKDANEERFVEFVQQAARAYNEPDGRVPREEMWASIVMARRQAAVARSRRRYVWAAVGMAATLAIGVAIGRIGMRAPEAPSVVAAVPVSGAGSASAEAFSVSTREHLRRAEALLVSYATPSAGSAGDTLVATWAREMLSTTRLLLDSPLSTDVARRRMLEDLERVLVQMVQVSPAERDVDVRANVERTIERKRMMTRLRALQSESLTSGS
jgi:hypothetical protein